VLVAEICLLAPALQKCSTTELRFSRDALAAVADWRIAASRRGGLATPSTATSSAASRYARPEVTKAQRIMKTIEIGFAEICPSQLGTVTGGIWYDETKSPSGEKWAFAVDRAGARLENYLTPKIGKNAASVPALLMMFAAEGPARWGGRAWDAV